jgi:hypothetical protein
MEDESLVDKELRGLEVEAIGEELAEALGEPVEVGIKAGMRKTWAMEFTPPGTAWAALGAAYRSRSLLSMARVREPGSLGSGKECV